MATWNIQGSGEKFFLTIVGLKAVDPRTKEEFEQIEEICCGRTAQELLIRFRNAKQGRHLLRMKFGGYEGINNTTNSTFVTSFWQLIGKEQESNSRKRKRKEKVTFLSNEDHPDLSSMDDSTSNTELSAEKYIGKFSLTVESLKEPPPKYLLRQHKPEWVEELKININGPRINKILPVVVDPEQVQFKEEFKEDQIRAYQFYTLGGNHLREAMKELDMEETEMTCHVYVNLTPEEALQIAYNDNTQMKSLPMTFQEKIKLARRFHLEGNNDLSSKMKEVLGKIEMKEIKDSISTIISVARYSIDSYELFQKLVDNYELVKGVHQSIPQRLFRLLQAEDNQVRNHYLSMATENNLQKTAENLEKNKKERAIERIFTEQTGVESWEEAKETFPNYSSKLKEFKDMKTPKYVPEKLLQYCKKAKDSADVLEEIKIDIKISISDTDMSKNKQVAAIIKKYSDKIIEDVQKVKGLLFEE